MKRFCKEVIMMHFKNRCITVGLADKFNCLNNEKVFEKLPKEQTVNWRHCPGVSFCSVRHAFVFYTCQVNFWSVLAFVTLTPSNGRCWSTVRCLIRSIYPLISFSLYPDLIYPSLEANFSSQELPLFAATRTFHDMDQTTSSTCYSILLTNG